VDGDLDPCDVSEIEPDPFFVPEPVGGIEIHPARIVVEVGDTDHLWKPTFVEEHLDREAAVVGRDQVCDEVFT
jgi:hypothetical protein